MHKGNGETCLCRHFIIELETESQTKFERIIQADFSSKTFPPKKRLLSNKTVVKPLIQK